MKKIPYLSYRLRAIELTDLGSGGQTQQCELTV